MLAAWLTWKSGEGLGAGRQFPSRTNGPAEDGEDEETQAEEDGWVLHERSAGRGGRFEDGGIAGDGGVVAGEERGLAELGHYGRDARSTQKE